VTEAEGSVRHARSFHKNYISVVSTEVYMQLLIILSNKII